MNGGRAGQEHEPPWGRHGRAIPGRQINRGLVGMDVNVLMGAVTGLMLSGLLVTSRQECAQWLLPATASAQRWTPPISGAVTGTGIFIASASLWLLLAALR